MARYTILLLLAGGCVPARQDMDMADAGTTHVQDSGVGLNNAQMSPPKTVEFADHCGKVLVGPHTVCVARPDMMTYEPDGGYCNWDDLCTEPPVAPIKVPENCWDSPTCACLEASGIVVCPIPDTICQDVSIVSTQLFCGCVGSCCARRSDGASMWTCACKNLDGTDWCMNSLSPQVCTDTPSGAVCSKI